VQYTAGVAVFSTHPEASEIGLHEMGHTAFGFADEYEYYAGCTSGEAGHDRYPGLEPHQPNVSIDIKSSKRRSAQYMEIPQLHRLLLNNIRTNGGADSNSTLGAGNENRPESFDSLIKTKSCYSMQACSQI
jgi:hypothetical protein